MKLYFSIYFCYVHKVLLFFGILLILFLLQGCLSGKSSTTILLGDEKIHSPNVNPHNLLVGARLGLVEGKVTVEPESIIVGGFMAKLRDAEVFRYLNYPLTGSENVLFEVGGEYTLQKSESLLFILKSILCGGTLFMVCPELSIEYEFIANVRALNWKEGKEVEQYSAIGKVQIQSRVVTLETEEEGMREAMKVAYNAIINQIEQDSEKYSELAASIIEEE